jgi:hypothetical protein
VPYLVRRFRSSARGASTAAFYRAIMDGHPIALVCSNSRRSQADLSSNLGSRRPDEQER